MTEPIYGTTTERLYKRLPAVYRHFDSQLHTDDNATLPILYPLKKFLSGLTDQLHDVDTTVERLKYVPIERRTEYINAKNSLNTYTRPAGLEDPTYGFDPINYTSDLFDARTADPEWLAWLGKLLGVKVKDEESEAAKRDKVVYAYVGFKAGSKQSMGNAVKEVLSGTKFARVFDHSTVVGGLLTPSVSEWDVTIMTKTSETPVPFDLAEVVTSKGAKPAGVVLYYLAYAITWGVLETALPTWTAIEATLTWDNLETSGAEGIPE